jgi:hypothetical protein
VHIPTPIFASSISRNFFLELDQSFRTDPVLYIRAVLSRRRVHRRRQRHGADQRWRQRHTDRKARGARVLHAEHLRNPPETSPRLSRIHAEHLRNPTKSYADSNRNQTKSMQNLTETNPNPTKSYADSNRNQTKPMQNLTETNPNPCKIHTLSIRNPTKSIQNPSKTQQNHGESIRYISWSQP